MPYPWIRSNLRLQWVIADVEAAMIDFVQVADSLDTSARNNDYDRFWIVPQLLSHSFQIYEESF